MTIRSKQFTFKQPIFYFRLTNFYLFFLHCEIQSWYIKLICQSKIKEFIFCFSRSQLPSFVIIILLEVFLIAEFPNKFICAPLGAHVDEMVKCAFANCLLKKIFFLLFVIFACISSLWICSSARVNLIPIQ